MNEIPDPKLPTSPEAQTAPVPVTKKPETMKEAGKRITLHTIEEMKKTAQDPKFQVRY
jgi:hypothetical protein